ncbi:MAG: three-Cys-motif partner protein TcmP [Gallionella sp.]|nr:three-Cys-motif partner protein TcmP [Gallionella sp.]
MSAKIKSVLWEAPLHTLAKISILRAYLSRWFGIFGRSRPRQNLWYVDGFAGPGEYTNSPSGSPVAAIASASEALQSVGPQWKAGKIHCVFIEHDAKRFDHLINKLGSSVGNPNIETHFFNLPFVDGLTALKDQIPNPFSPASPLFAFIDPFGAKGVPFADIKDLLSRNAAEVLINFDSDGIGRIFRAEEAANHEPILNGIFGDDSWKTDWLNIEFRMSYIVASWTYTSKNYAHCRRCIMFLLSRCAPQRTSSTTIWYLQASIISGWRK